MLPVRQDCSACSSISVISPEVNRYLRRCLSKTGLTRRRYSSPIAACSTASSRLCKRMLRVHRCGPVCEEHDRAGSVLKATVKGRNVRVFLSEEHDRDESGLKRI